MLWILLLPWVVPARQYFQQEVKVQIKVRLLPATLRLEGQEKLWYINHSPDTLAVLYFHLYWNKFRAHSYARPFASRERGFIQVISLKDASGRELPFQEDNTILKLPLPQALLPGDTLQLNIEFAAAIPPASGRFGYSGDHFDIGNWYPVPAVYDQQGWHIDQHLDGEFYQEWADYEVWITVPRDFVVAATGELVNPEAYPDSVAFAERTIDYFDYQHPDTSTVTYHFRARRVHDFAFSANPEFVLKTIQAGHTQLHFFLQPYRLKTWQSILEDCRKGFLFLQEHIGPYPYSQLSIVDGVVTAGGIEYPNLVIINGYIIDRKELAITVLHEMAHQWFYGLLANNQTRHGWMDEGFASFYEIWATEYLWGREGNLSSWQAEGLPHWFSYQRNARQEALLRYLEYALSGKEEPIDTHFDYFQHNPYIPTYDKMAVGLFTLKNLLGDSLFLRAIRGYYHRWRFRHPYPADLIRAFNDFTGMELSWFWHQWLHTTWRCDLRVRRVWGEWREAGERSDYQARILLEKAQPLSFPVYLSLQLSDGSRRRYRIPIPGWLTEPDSLDLPSWHPANRKYLVSLRLPAPVKSVQLDPDHLLPDINPFNNDLKKLPRLRWYWLRRQYLAPDTGAYPITIFPTVFYNDVDGFKLGVRTVGNFVGGWYHHQGELLVAARKGFGGFSFGWNSPLPGASRDLRYHLYAYRIDGRQGGEVALSFRWQKGWAVHRLHLGWGIRHVYAPAYLPRPWQGGRVSTFVVEWQRKRPATRYRRLYSNWFLRLELGAPGGQYTFSRWQISYRPEIRFAPQTRLRFHVNAGEARGEVPVEYRFYPSGAAPVREFGNAFARARGTVPIAWVREGHFRLPGGGEVLSAEQEWAVARQGATRLLAAGMALQVGNPLNRFAPDVPYLSTLKLALYSNWAQLDRWKVSRRSAFGELGLSLWSQDIPWFLRYLGLRGVRIWLPFWSNRPGPGHQPWQLRWAMSLEFQPFR